MKILISAAETSSDSHGAALLKALRALEPSVDAFGIGGSKLQAEGLRAVVDARELLSMGFVEILGRLPRIFRALSRVAREAEREMPEVAVVIDYPDFHFRLARKLKALGIPVVYFIPPKVWVWRKGRVKTLRKLFARLLCIFPFEEEFYRRENVAVKYVGNPLLDQLPLSLTREEARARLGIDPARKTLLLMPGSRPGELKHHLECLLDAAFHAASNLKEQLLILLPSAHTTEVSEIEQRVSSWREGAEGVWEAKSGKFPLELRVSQGDAHGCMVAADAGIVKSGTSTLEAALLGCPHVIVYRSNWLSQWVFHNLIRYRGPVGLANLIAGWQPGKPYLVKELLGAEMTGDAVSVEIISLFRDTDRCARARRGFEELRSKMFGDGSTKPSENAAREVLEVARASRGVARP